METNIKLSHALLFCAIIGIFGYFYGKTTAISHLEKLPPDTVTVTHVIQAPLPPPPVNIPAKPIIIKDTAALALIQAKVDEYLKNSDSLRSRITDLMIEREATYNFEQRMGELTISGHLSQLYNPLTHIFTNTLSLNPIVISEQIVTKTLIVRQPGWVRPVCIGLGAATVILVQHEQYGWALGTGGVAITLCIFDF